MKDDGSKTGKEGNSIKTALSSWCLISQDFLRTHEIWLRTACPGQSDKSREHLSIGWHPLLGKSVPRA